MAEHVITKIRRTDDNPHDRLTRLAAVAIAAAEADPEWREGDRIFAAADDGRHSGIGAHNYDSMDRLADDLLRHARAVSRS